MKSQGSQFEQLKMFMTPREIMSKYQPLDGDRLDYEGEAYTRSGGSVPVGSKRREYWKTPGGRDREVTGYGPTDSRGYKQAVPSRRHVRDQGVENDEQLWDRKLEESQWESDVAAHRPFEETGRARTTGGRSNYPQRTGDYTSGGNWNSWTARGRFERHDQSESLYESIQRTGVTKPVSLGTEIGDMGKPQVVGGHHRLAAQRDINQDQFIPVLHFTSLQAARNTHGYKYT